MASFRFLLTIVSLFISLAAAGHTIVDPQGPEDIVITAANTLNSTQLSLGRVLLATSASAGALNLSFVNNLDSDNVHAYVTGLDVDGALVLLLPNGTYYYPTAGTSGVPVAIDADVAIPLGEYLSTTTITLPEYLVSGRIWFADGTLEFFTVPGADGASLVEPSAASPTDPNAGTNWGFVELTSISTGMYVNLSFVDFLGMPLGITLNGSEGVQTALGTTSAAVTDVCDKLTARSAVSGAPWDELCVSTTSGTILRVISPELYQSLYPTAFENAFTAYVNKVWKRFEEEPLQIDTQTTPGVINCTVVSGNMTCGGESLVYAKPSSLDIFGCNSGPFATATGSAINLAVIPRLCAAFNRATLMRPRGDYQPLEETQNYYLTAPNNFYAKFVKKYEIDGKGYAFSYDDVTPTDGPDTSGLLADVDPYSLTVTVGGPSS